MITTSPIIGALTCPRCGAKQQAEIPEGRCVPLYVCDACGEHIAAKVEDCCVFCSYGDRRCPVGHRQGMKRPAAIAIVLALFVLPFALVAGGVVPVDLRRWLYIFAGVVTIAVARREGWSFRDLGIRWDNARAAALPYGILAALGAMAIVTVALAMGRVPAVAWWAKPHFALGLFIPVSAAQELFYRGLLIPLLQCIHAARWFVIVANAALFAFLHIIFPNAPVVMPLSFLGGLVFAWLWLRWPNLWLASAAHVVLNAAFVLFCFGSFDGSCIR